MDVFDLLLLSNCTSVDYAKMPATVAMTALLFLFDLVQVSVFARCLDSNLFRVLDCWVHQFGMKNAGFSVQLCKCFRNQCCMWYCNMMES
jgi:hypothetical protein